MLRPRHTALLLASLLVAALTVVAPRQASSTEKLREEVSALRAARSAAVPAAERSTTPPEPAAEPPREAASAVVNWQTEVEKLRQEVAEAEALATSDPARRPAGNHMNRGGASAFDTFETILWAATGGEVGELEKWIAFSPPAAAAAARFLDTLPLEMRAEFPDARRLIATMMASRLPLNIAQAELLESRVLDSGETALRLRLTRSGSTAKTRELQLRFQRSDAGWRLLVPPEIIESYHYLLTGSLTEPAAPHSSANPSLKPIR